MKIPQTNHGYFILDGKCLCPYCHSGRTKDRIRLKKKVNPIKTR